MTRHALPALVSALVAITGCDDLPDERVSSPKCRCSVALVDGLDALPGQLLAEAAVEVGDLLDEHYLVVEAFTHDQGPPQSLIGRLTAIGQLATPLRTMRYTEVDGYPAVWTEVADQTEDGLDLRKRYFVVEAPSRLLVIQIWSLADRWNGNLARTRALIETFEIDDPGPSVARWQDEPPADLDPRPLLQARAEDGLRLLPREERPAFERVLPPVPPGGSFRQTTYRSGPVERTGYVARPEADPESDSDPLRRPLVVWVGGYGATPVPWTTPYDDGAMMFVEADFVVWAPLFRGEAGDSENREYLGGEVDDLLAAIEHARAWPSVDPERIYVVGEGNRGTVALLAATTGLEVRATLVTGARASISGDVYGAPFVADATALRLRSALHWADRLESPVLAFLGDNEYALDLAAMTRAARASGRWMEFYMLPRPYEAGGRPALRAVLVRKLVTDDPTEDIFDVSGRELWDAVRTYRTAD